MFLDWVCCGAPYQSIARTYDISKAVVVSIIHDAVNVLGRDFVSDMIYFPSGSRFLDAMTDFESLCKLPMCAGAIDGTFIRITKPTNFGDAFYCYKKYCAILLLACVDAHGRFTYIRAGEPGSAGDAASWNRSEMCLKLEAVL